MQEIWPSQNSAYTFIKACLLQILAFCCWNIAQIGVPGQNNETDPALLQLFLKLVTHSQQAAYMDLVRNGDGRHQLYEKCQNFQNVVY